LLEVMKTYRINEIFYSIQGEGGRAGEPSVFIRFTGCNLRCAIEPSDRSPGGFDCDTEFESGRPMTDSEILTEVARAGGQCRWVVFTGGEPALQLDAGLVRLFHDQGYKCAIETNGSLSLEDLNLDWICVSPKVAEHAIRQITAEEVKYVRAVGQAIPRTRVTARLKFISPAFDGLSMRRETLEHCVALCKENPEWRLSLQIHKFLNLR
jgi:7-carboxy-7-deazaguanine synthase